MATYTIELKDGRKAKIEAASPQAAMKLAGTIPPLKGDKADYQRELLKKRGQATSRYQGLTPLDRKAESLTSQLPIPVLDEIQGGVAAAGNAAVNLFRRPEDKVSSKAIYEANRDARNEYDAKLRKEFPVTSFTGGLLAPAPLVGPGLKLATGSASAMRKAATAVGAGGLLGGLGGAAQGRTAKERVDNATGGGLLGAGLGTAGVTGAVVASKAAPLVRGAATDLKRGMKRLRGDEAQAAADAAREAEAGTKSAVAILQRKGLTSENVGERAAPFEGMGVTAAELGGPDVVRQTGSVSRRGGTTGDRAAELVAGRNEGRDDRLLGGAQADLKVNPAVAARDVEEMVKTGRALADPEYARMREQTGGVSSPELDALMQHPIVREAIRQEKRLGRINDSRGVGLAYGDVAVPSRPVGPGDLGVGGGEVQVPRGPAQAPSQGPELKTFLRQSGLGLDDVGDDLAGRGMRINLSGGRQLDDAALQAFDAGYFPELGRRPTINEFLDALTDGRPRYARAPDPAAQQRFEGRAAAEELNRRGGDPGDVPSPEQYEGSFAAPERPMTEPARTLAPTQDTLDKVLRRIDQGMTRDRLTGKIIRDGSEGFGNEERELVGRRARDLLFGGEAPLAPELGAARAVSGDYKSLEGAFDRGRGLLASATPRDFSKAYRSLKTDAEKEMFRNAVAADIFDMWGRKQLTPGRMTQPAMRDKLRLAFGGDEAAKFIQRIESEARLSASGGRLSPTGGSGTMGWTEGAKETDEAMNLFDVVGAVGRAVRHPLQTLGEGAQALAAYGRTSGTSEAMRDAFGDVMLMGPDDLAVLLRQFENLPPPVQRAVSQRAAQIGMFSGRVASQAQQQDEPIY